MINYWQQLPDGKISKLKKEYVRVLEYVNN